MARSRIIDISQWNTVTNWDLVKANVDAVIIRVGFTYSRTGDICIDRKYVENRKTCKSKNIPYSLYYFTNAINEEEARREAEFVAYECRDLSKFILPVFVDSEIVDGQGRADNLDKETRTKCIRAFCSTLQAYKIPAGYYTNPDFIQNRIDRTRLPFSLWLAHWDTTTPFVSDYTIWQYTSKGSVPGIEGNVDLSKEPDAVVTPKDSIIALAMAELDYLEKRDSNLTYLYTKDQNAGDNNYTKYGLEMHNLQPYNMDYPAPWCMCFISWVFVKFYGLAGAKNVLCGDIDDYTVAAADRFMRAGRWFSTPEVGDLIFFKDEKGIICHVGLVWKTTNGAVYTIEGNTSSAAGVVPNGGCVRMKSYGKTNSRIAGYGRPKY